MGQMLLLTLQPLAILARLLRLSPRLLGFSFAVAMDCDEEALTRNNRLKV